MKITVGAKCWDGEHRTSVRDQKKVEVLALPQIAENRFKYDPRVGAIISFAVPLLFAAGSLPHIGIATHAIATAAVPADAVPAMAAVSDDMKSKIIHAFDPLIHLAQSLAYPIAGIMIAGGCLMIMIRQREQGMKMLQDAAIGYILVQLSPLLLQLLVGIGSGV